MSILPSCTRSGEEVPDARALTNEIPETYDDIQHLIFDASCVPSCHNGGSAPKGLYLDRGLVLASMVGVPASESPSLLRITQGDPQNSYLIVKLQASNPRRIARRMPTNGPPYLDTGQVEALERWIAAGASEDWVDLGSPPQGRVVLDH